MYLGERGGIEGDAVVDVHMYLFLIGGQYKKSFLEWWGVGDLKQTNCNLLIPYSFPHKTNYL